MFHIFCSQIKLLYFDVCPVSAADLIFIFLTTSPGKTGIHPVREHLSKVPDAIECEHLPTQVGYDDELQSGRDPDEDDEHADELP